MYFSEMKEKTAQAPDNPPFFFQIFGFSVENFFGGPFMSFQNP